MILNNTLENYVDCMNCHLVDLGCEKIFWLQKQEWKTELMFIEWDCRHGKEREATEEKGYFIYDCFTEDETADIMETGYENTIDVLNTKKQMGLRNN